MLLYFDSEFKWLGRSHPFKPPLPPVDRAPSMVAKCNLLIRRSLPRAYVASIKFTLFHFFNYRGSKKIRQLHLKAHFYNGTTEVESFHSLFDLYSLDRTSGGLCRRRWKRRQCFLAFPVDRCCWGHYHFCLLCWGSTLGVSLMTVTGLLDHTM